MTYILSDLQIELAGICSAHCSYCTWERRSVGKQLMDVDTARAVISDAAKMNIPLATFHGVGESCLHPQLTSLLHLAEFCGLNMRLSTNCFNLRGALANELRHFRNLQLILAIPWVMDRKFVERCIQNVVDFLAAPTENREVHIQMVCDQSARPWYDTFIDTFLPISQSHPNVTLYLKQPRTWPNDTPNIGFIPPATEGVRRDDIATPISLGRGCNMPERFLMVLADGTCVPCCVGMDESWNLGNIKGRSLQEVWESSEMEVVRDKWRRHDMSIPCGHCLDRGDC